MGDQSVEQKLVELLGSGVTSSGDEELLRLGAKFARQITAPQMRLIVYLYFRAEQIAEKNPKDAKLLQGFVRNWLELKSYNNSDVFIMRFMDSISLRRFWNENSMRANIEKKQ